MIRLALKAGGPFERMPTKRESPAAPPSEPDARGEAIAERRSRSLEEPLGVIVVQRRPYPVFRVRNPMHRTEYRVFGPTFPSDDVWLCTCPDFARRGLGRCKHVEAAARYARRHLGRPEESAPSEARPESERTPVTAPDWRWRAFEERFRALAADGSFRDIRRLRWAGDPLLRQGPE